MTKKILCAVVLAVTLALSASAAWAAPTQAIDIDVASIGRNLHIRWASISPWGPGWYYWFGESIFIINKR